MLPYKPRLTSEILEDIDVRLFVNILIEANKNLAIYKTKLENSKTPWKLLSPLLMVSESLCSSRIEGTQTTLDEVLEVEANNAYMNADVTEVVNYYEALKKGEERLKELPISTRLIKELHEVLLSNNARGKNKSPGEYRKIQNYIGAKGCTIKTATFVPPEPELVDYYMSDLEKFINDDSIEVDSLIKIAIIHAQFETIHPFLDGNGRIGRILIPLFLYNSKTLDKPNFFLSATLEKDKHKYYRLLNDTRNNKWADWVEFFLESINTQAKNDIVRLKNIEISYEDTINKAKHVIKSNKIIDIIDMLYGKPICTAKNIAEFTGIPIRTCRKYLNILEDEKIIYSDQKIRNKIYYNYDLLNLIR